MYQSILYFYLVGIRDFIFSKSMLEMTQKMVNDTTKQENEADDDQIGQYSIEFIVDQHKDFVKA